MRIIGKNQSYFNRIIKTMLVISIIPVILLGILSYQSSSSAIQKKVMVVNQQLLVQTKMRFEQTLNIVYNYYVLLGNKDIITDNLSKNLSYSDVVVIPEIQAKLMELQNLQSIVNSVNLVNLDKNWIITNDSFEDTIDSEYKNFVEKGMNNEQNIYWVYNSNNKEELSLFIKVPYNKPEQTGAIIVNFGYDEFKAFFNQKENYEILVLDELGHIVYSNNESQVGINILEIFDQDSLEKRDESKGYFNAVYEDKEVGILYENSDFTGLSYLMVYSIEELTSEVKSIRTLTIWMILLLIVGISIVTFFGSKKLYSPVKDIYQNITKISSAGETKNMDEVKFIGKEIDTLIDKQQEMQNKLQTQIFQIEELFLLKLVKGELTREQIVKRSQTIGKFISYAHYVIVTFQVNYLMNSEERTKDEDLMVLLLRNGIQEYIDKTKYLVPIIRDGVVITLIDSDILEVPAFKEYVFSFAERVQRAIQDRLDLSITIGISNIYNNSDRIQIAFKESLEAIMCKNAVNDSILFYEDVEPGKVIKMVYPKNLEDELIKAFNKRDLEKAEWYVDTIIDTIFSHRIGYNEHKIYVNRLLIAIMNILQDAGVSIQSIFDQTDGVMEQVISLTDPQEIQHWFKNKLVRPLILILVDQRNNKNDLLVKEIIQMIENEYDQDISLELCADRLNYHPSYIWKIMKQELGKSFTDYLMDYRLKQAKILLIETDETVARIADKLRYTNPQNFIRYFKKLEGITPGKYRKNNQG